MLKSFVAFCLFALFYHSVSAQTSGGQFIHNCADVSADTVDIYYNGAIIDTNFAYKNATGFLTFPSSVPINIGIAHKHSAGANDTIRSFKFDSLTTGENYIFIISGVTGNNFAANPDGRNSAFDLKVIANPVTADTVTQFAFTFFNGATDEPGLDVTLVGGPEWIHGAKYGDVLPYNQVGLYWTEWDIYNQDSSANLGKWIADFTNDGGQAGVILASGFAEPDSNNNGPALSLYIVFASGTVFPLPPENAFYQFLHNSADPSIDSIDVYLDGKKRYADLPFRSSTPALTVKAKLPFTIALAPKNSASQAQAFWTETDTFGVDTFYMHTATGLLGTGFAPNPDGINTAFQVLKKVPAEIAASSGGNFDFFFIHGVTDAPMLNVQLSGGPDIITDAGYTEQTNYFSFIPTEYILQVQDTAGNSTYPYYVTNLSGLAARSGVILASGFLDPALNNNGPAFGLFMATAQGGPFIQLSTNTAINETDNHTGLDMFPNPANNYLQINFELTQPGKITIQIVDMNGQLVNELLNDSSLTGKQNVITDLTKLSSGIYFVRVIAEKEVSNRKIVVLR